jgi:hypothetical protein
MHRRPYEEITFMDGNFNSSTSLSSSLLTVSNTTREEKKKLNKVQKKKRNREVKKSYDNVIRFLTKCHDKKAKQKRVTS